MAAIFDCLLRDNKLMWIVGRWFVLFGNSFYNFSFG